MVCARSGFTQDFAVGVEVRGGASQSFGYVEARGGCAQSFVTGVQARSGVSQRFRDNQDYQLFELPVLQPATYATEATALAIRAAQGVEFTGVDGDRVKSWSVTQRRNSPTNWTITLNDTEREYLPSGAEGMFEDEFQITITGPGGWKSPKLLLLKYEWKWEGGPVCVLSGTDYSHKLLGGEETMPDMAATTVGQAIQAICAKYGVSVSVDIPEVYLKKYSPKGGSPMDWIRDLCYLAQADWWFEGDTLVIRAQSKGSGPSWTAQDFHNVLSFSYAFSPIETVNEVLVSKLEESGSLLAEAVCEGGDCIGFGSTKWDGGIGAMSVVCAIENVVRGKIHSFSWKDQADNGIAGPGGTYLGANPCYGVQWIYEPHIGNSQGASQLGGTIGAGWPPNLKPGYKMKFYGRKTGSEPEEQDTGFKVLRKNAAHQTKFGRRAAPAIRRTEIADAKAAERLADGILVESVKMQAICNAEFSVFDAGLNPADTIGMTLGWPGFSNKQFRVESVTKSGDNQRPTKMSVEGTAAA